MVTLKELYKSLALSVLNNTSVVTDDKMGIYPTKIPYMLEFINEGITRLHSRFVLKTDSIYIEMQEGRTDYPLLARFAFTQYDPSKGVAPYILDSFAKPFQQDVIKVLSVYDNQGHERRLNDNNDTHGLFLPRPDTLKCIRPRHEEIISVVYQARHPMINEGDEEAEIDLPDTLLPALKYWLAYSVYTSMNTAESTGKAAEYLQMYESICGEVEDYDLANGSISTTNSVFEERGWI